MTTEPQDQSGKSRRISVDLAPNVVLQLDRLKAETGWTTADVFRRALSLVLMVHEAQRRGEEIVLRKGDTSVGLRFIG
jgi:hypothetical protein